MGEDEPAVSGADAGNYRLENSMTKTRVFGSDVPFLEWLRGNRGIDSVNDGIAVTDTDIMVHQYKSAIVDAEGRRNGFTRNIQALMAIEVKTRGGLPNTSQQDTLWKSHLTVKPLFRLGTWTLRNFGWSFVSLSGLRPDDSKRIRWGRFDIHGQIEWSDIQEELLTDLIAFLRHPDNFDARVFRRHHKTQNVWRMEKQPLGFKVPVLEVRRS
jgi:hypothetical protein